MYSVQAEAALGERHVARVVPVGDVDVVVGAAWCARCRAAAWRSGRTSAPRSARGAARARPAWRSAAACRRRRGAPLPRPPASRGPATRTLRMAQSGRRCVTSASRITSQAAASWRCGGWPPRPRLPSISIGTLARAIVRSGHIRSFVRLVGVVHHEAVPGMWWRASATCAPSAPVRGTWIAARRSTAGRARAPKAPPWPSPRPPAPRPAARKRAPAARAPALTLSSKNYSSWSLRGWLLARFAGLDFDEVMVSPDDADARKELLLLAPSIRVPCLTHDGAKVWNTLAIAQYLDEICPDAGPDAGRPHRPRALPLGQRRDELRLRQPALGAADEPQGAPPGLQDLGRRAARHRPHRRDLDRVPGRLRRARSCSASSARWPTRCTRRWSRAS